MSDALSGEQYLRSWLLTVFTGGNGLVLSSNDQNNLIRIKFRVNAPDLQTPNTATIRVYNLAPDTINKVQKEFTMVALQAGYENSNTGIIFTGQIKQFRRGRESAIDTYLDILAADGDEAYNFALVSTTLESGASNSAGQIKAVSQAMAQYGVTVEGNPVQNGGFLPRGKVLWGLGRSYLRSIAAGTGYTWSIQNGKIIFTPLTGYRPGEAVVLTAATGLIGQPEATDNGIKMRCLINPAMRVGGLVQLNNAGINSATILNPFFPGYTSLNLIASLANDGFYKILVIEYDGDTRGIPWYCELTCIAAPQGQSIQPYQ